MAFIIFTYVLYFLFCVIVGSAAQALGFGRFLVWFVVAALATPPFALLGLLLLCIVRETRQD